MEKESYITVPHKITDRSFQIIQEEIDKIDPHYKFDSPLQEAVIKRAIHTTADFDYLKNLKFTHDVLNKLKHVLLNQGVIYTDTTMALSGINKRRLDKLGVDYHCLIRDPRVIQLAQEKGITRSMAAVEIAANDPREKIFIVGNAPTALCKIIELVNDGQLKVAAVIGVPVGFVEAAESKQALYESDIPAIAALGRKGGSNLAAALINAVMYNMDIKNLGDEYGRHTK
ncbi:cobalt-precorrin-8 methylmutase [Limosilactobacillus reuteri]|uniref:cobalt-precorrin-8 methylmutase n=1 Tax=Limosilactobacillus reuteri TaxID=1598 RepID=UPI001E2C869C|nr:cobalt-precorrin-8 methylmutase [Limosilactobacillus reuteri]MCC4386802.1 cobalt-precorrin-8 methylmutase [Limosilactobacillus reuteri]MCC4392540.1 cobalt-precorrin-8 methylmutase [Limosilactobacillus reuteri]